MYKRKNHSKYCLKAHIVFVTKYRKKTDKDNIKVKTLVLDDDNYIQIRVDCFEQHSVSYQSTSDKMSDIVKIFEHVFKMLDKNFRREK